MLGIVLKINVRWLTENESNLLVIGNPNPEVIAAANNAQRRES